jgi:hypothetical protein
VDAGTLAKAFGIEAEDEDAELEDTEAELEADTGTLDSDIELAFDTSASADDRREAFIRAVKSAMKG